MSSLRTSILRIVAEAFPTLVYGYPRTYRVVAVRGDKRLDLEPPPDAQHLPELAAVEQWGDATRIPDVGTEVCVWFRDSDPSRPVVVGFAFERDEAQQGVARIGDPVDVELQPAIVNGKLNGLDMIGMIVWSPPTATGNITTSSGKHEVG